ncbi:MAG: CBS domain-containing protein [Chloroflexota bacterium]
MRDHPRLARQTTVEACEQLLDIGPLLVPKTADLRDVVRLAARQSQTRLIGVVDEPGRIVGVIPVTQVAESIVARVVPEALLVDVEDAATATRFSHSMEDRTAADIMQPPAIVNRSDTIGDAFRLMHRRRLGGVYIVDNDGWPTGYLDLLELALVYVRALDDAPMTTNLAAVDLAAADLAVAGGPPGSGSPTAPDATTDGSSTRRNA